jgi:hypothetical protein
VKRLTLALAALAIAGLLSACLPPPAEQAPTPAYTKGFDACAAPSVSTMKSWKASSPYVNIGVYIGGANRGCAQPNLTSSWLSSVWGQGWKLLPIWVGPQAPCTNLGSTTTLSYDGTSAFFQGLAEGSAAADAANTLGMGWMTPIYYDMEAYNRGGACSASVQAFTGGWVRMLNARGYRAGMYSSLCSGILDVAVTASDPSGTALNAVWLAAWNGSPKLYGYGGSSCPLSDSIWNNHQRVHQYLGGHNESYGGITVNVDSNAVDGPTG